MIRDTVGRPVLASLAGFFLSALLAAPVPAQETGAITGRVTAQATGQPLESVQVTVPGTGLGTLTGPDGEFRIEEVPAEGRQQVRAQLVGYATRTRRVNVQTGQITTVNFELARKAIQLEQIVVTGTGTQGIQQKRLGNSISSINTDQIESSSTQGFEEMLSGRTAGVNVNPASGMSGEGQKIRVRGASSISQSNEPIVYVDGVRVNNAAGFGPAVAAGATGTGASSRLDDINPESIERIEVLKGAAAATLYGTQASNGVIQIFTKSGREGAPRWNFEVEQSLEFMKQGRLTNHADFAGAGRVFNPLGETVQQQQQRFQEQFGVDVEPYEVFSVCRLCEIDETGRLTNINGSVNGGSEGVTYFASAFYQNLDGIFGIAKTFDPPAPANDQQEQWNVTANTQIFPSDELNIQTKFAWNRTNQTSPTTANTIFGAVSNLFGSQLRLTTERNQFGAAAFATVEEASQIQVSQSVDHFNGSLQTNYRPGSDLTLHATVGADVTSNQAEELFPFGWTVDDFGSFFENGTMDASSVITNVWTAELRGGWEQELGQFSSSLTVGSQGFITQNKFKGGEGTDFPGPGLQNVAGASQQVARQSFSQSTQMGFFAQEQVGYRDFAYVTLGGRFDVNSAFGEDISGEFFPKVSTSIVISDLEAWESELLSTVRVRGAWGQSGLQPDAFDKQRTFQSLPSVQGPGVEPDQLGAELKPEVTTEIEAGINLGLFQDRLSIDATYWDRETTDGLIPRTFPPSGGFGGSAQLVNIGKLTASGVDLELNWQAITGDETRLSVFANTAYLTQEVADIGAAPPIKASGAYPRDRNFVMEGHPPFAFFGAKLADVPEGQVPLQASLSACDPWTREEALSFFSQPRNPSDFEVFPKECENPTQMLQQFLGKPDPDFAGSFGFDLTFLEDFTLGTLVSYEVGDRYHQCLSCAFRRSNPVIGRNTPGSAEVTSTMLDPESTPEERLNAALRWAREFRALAPMSGLNQVWQSGFAKLREADITWRPDDLAGRLGFRTLSISLKGRNLASIIHDDYHGIDPELDEQARCAGIEVNQSRCILKNGQEGWRMPIPRRVSLAVSLGF